VIWAVVPFECHASKVGAIDIFRDTIVFLESLVKMIQVGIANIMNGNAANNECKHDGVPLVTPETMGVGCLVVVKFSKAVLEEVVSKDACLGETIHAMVHFEADPEVTGKLIELVLLNEFLGNVSKLDADILWAVEVGVEIEILEVHGGKLSVTLREITVVEQFFKFNQARGGTYISRIRDIVAANSNACRVSVVSLLWLDLANDHGVGDFLAALGWDHVIKNGEEGVGAFDAITIAGTGADALA
jgi:hypothetical protein